MNVKQAIKAMLANKKTTAVAVSDAMGHSSTYVTTCTNRAGMTVQTLCDIADAMGYELVLRPRRMASRRAEDDLVVGKESE